MIIPYQVYLEESVQMVQTQEDVVEPMSDGATLGVEH